MFYLVKKGEVEVTKATAVSGPEAAAATVSLLTTHMYFGEVRTLRCVALLALDLDYGGCV